MFIKLSVQRSMANLVFTSLILEALPVLAAGQGYNGCTQLANETWAGLVQAINDSFIIASLCPFRISGDGCPTKDEYPDGIVFGRGNNDVIIVECDAITDRFGADNYYYTQCIIDCPGRHFTVASAPPGLILTNMYLSGATRSSISVEAGSGLEVVNTVFYNNSAGDDSGGAIVVQEGSSIDIEFSTFRKNRAGTGGALHIRASTVAVKQSIFLGNRASTAGGAFAIDSTSNVDIENSSFAQNAASEGGALNLAELGDLVISQSVFKDNFSLVGGALFTAGSASIDGSTFQDNTGVEGGGAINCDLGSSTVLFRNTFVNNESEGFGPAVYDQYNSGVLEEGNTGCGNLVKIDGRAPMDDSLQCEGVYILAGRRRLLRCQPFQNECIAPTKEPSISPEPSFSPSAEQSGTETEFPSMFDSGMPSLLPTSTFSMLPSSAPTPTAPSFHPSPLGSDARSEAPSVQQSWPSSSTPSDGPSLLPTQHKSSFSMLPSNAPTPTAPSFHPSPLGSNARSESPSLQQSWPSSSTPSGGPSLFPTQHKTSLPADGPSLVASDVPSSIPSDVPSLVPSDAPSITR